MSPSVGRIDWAARWDALFLYALSFFLFHIAISRQAFSPLKACPCQSSPVSAQRPKALAVVSHFQRQPAVCPKIKDRRTHNAIPKEKMGSEINIEKHGREGSKGKRLTKNGIWIGKK
ncbi:hypothetical protein Ddc_14715 [Ditylenchus destructor]|nr:hypothetical protein Ddc_14715 [Ditylenchus destructor]